MRKLKNNPKLEGYNDFSLTGDMRDYITKHLGKLDVAKSFMYLFLRFGEPNGTNKDEYKQLYDYWLKLGIPYDLWKLDFKGKYKVLVNNNKEKKR